MLQQNGFGFSSPLIGYASADQCAATTHTFGIDMSFVVIVSGVFQCSDYASGCRAANTTDGGADRRGGEPSSSDDRT